MLNALFGSMLALAYTNDIFTAYVFIEILTIASCALIMAKGTAQAMVGTTHYLVISLLGSGTILLGISILYSITGHLLFPQMKEAIVHLSLIHILSHECTIGQNYGRHHGAAYYRYFSCFCQSGTRPQIY